MSRFRHTLSHCLSVFSVYFNSIVFSGQCYISSVEADSPAHYAGLKAGDRIIEVQYTCTVKKVHMYRVKPVLFQVEGVSVGLENQGQVVARVAASGSELSLLVADTECEEWHEARDIVITSSLPHVVSRNTENPYFLALTGAQ